MSSHPAIEFNQHNSPDCNESRYGGSPVLQHCADCGTVQYPSRELCRTCLGSKLEWKPLESNKAKVLANTQLHNSLDEYFTKRMPWNLVSIQLELNSLGTLLVHSSGDKKAGDRVELNVIRDHSGMTALLAITEGEDVDAIWQKLFQDKTK